MKLNFIFLSLLAIFSVAMLSCGKDSEISTSGNTRTPVVPFESLVSFKTTPLPTVNLNMGIIPNLKDFYVTNKGPYVQIQNSPQQRWSVYKYQGELGSNSWSSFIPNYTSQYFIPKTYTAERDNEFSIYYLNDDIKLAKPRYGLYNLNNGTPSLDFEVPGSPRGPGIFSALLPSKTSLAFLWGIFVNEIWYETAVAVPKTFKFIVKIPETFGYVNEHFSDPDDGFTLWCATQNRLYQVTSLPAPGGSPIKDQWNFSSISTTDYISSIIKVNGSIVVQFGNKVYKLSEGKFSLIGTLNLSAVPFVSNICTNGSTIFASDGTYYNSTTAKWKSFIGSGTNLSPSDAIKYGDLKAFISAGLPIGCLNGSGSGPVYLLGLNSLIQISPNLN